MNLKKQQAQRRHAEGWLKAHPKVHRAYFELIDEYDDALANGEVTEKGFWIELESQVGMTIPPDVKRHLGEEE